MPKPLDNFRDEIAETAASMAIQCQMIALHTELRDDVGLHYSIKRLVAYTKALAGMRRDMIEAKVRAHERKEAARATDAAA